MTTTRSRNGRTGETRARESAAAGRAKQRALMIGALEQGDDLSELQELLRTAGVAVVGQLVQHLERPHPNTYLGPGKVDELRALLKAGDANVVACDDELSPRQERNLERLLDVPVVDRTTVILDIFAGHAHTAEGKLQVELAQLQYNLARMRGLWTHLERLGAGGGAHDPVALAEAAAQVAGDGGEDGRLVVDGEDHRAALALALAGVGGCGVSERTHAGVKLALLRPLTRGIAAAYLPDAMSVAIWSS